jgi:hypothetical protein
VVPAQEASFGDVLIYFLPKLRFSARDEIDCMGPLRCKPLSAERSPAGDVDIADAGRVLPTENVRKHDNLTWFERDQPGSIAANLKLEKIKIKI